MSFSKSSLELLPSNESCIIILINKKQFDTVTDMPTGIESINYIQSKEFIKNIYATYYVVYNTHKKICEIRYVIDDNNHLKEVVDILHKNFPKDFYIWAGLIPYKKSDQYIQIGFNSPYKCKISPLKHKLKTSGIAFIKLNNPKLKLDIKSVKNNLEHIFTKQTETCKMHICFTQPTINYLKKLNEQSDDIKKEQAGSLTIKQIHKKNNKIIFELKEKPDSVKSGHEEEVDAVVSRYNFHTHPKHCYINNNVTNGWPSSSDYAAFVKLDVNTILHIVVTIEGIYTISFTQEWVGKNKKIDTEYVLDRYEIDNNKKISYKTYVNKINKLKYKNKSPLFIVTYMPWDKATDVFPIYFSKTETDKCLTTDAQFDMQTSVHTSEDSVSAF